MKPRKREDKKKVITLAEAKKNAQKLRREGKKIVFTNGCFDVLHIGHIRTFKFCKRRGDVLIVGLNSDASVRSLKGNTRPLVPEKERAEILSALSDVDYVIIFKTRTPLPLIKVLKPDVHVKGGDYKNVTALPEYPVVKQYGGKVVLAPEIKNKSTTKLMELIQSMNA
jgi:glycerol-3-phosphate cytidylyltransferase